ncbi:hypothetical protein [Herbaspirillum chlorophenolicum]|uniref:hypothetical protein n=1 Tax=Herbaspirillum chlorophenolicum TaxID=211589 RepID=UPI00067AA958|nr:hypothetical protein [Herbaspirillum chlorophenolicum]
MGCYINSEIGYYEGDQISHHDQEVPQRPDPNAGWDGQAWQASPAPVPTAVTPLQARRALLAAGLLNAVDQAAAAAGGEAQLAWAYSATVERASPFVAALASAIGLSNEDVDELFRQAAQYTI